MQAPSATIAEIDPTDADSPFLHFIAGAIAGAPDGTWASK